jgi:hypothetical protein
MPKLSAQQSSLGEVTAAIHKIENARNLLTWKVAGTYPWVLMRTTVLRLANERLGNYEVRKESGHEFDPNVPKRLGENVIIQFLRLDANGIDKFSKPLSDAMGDKAVVLNFGQVKTFAKNYYDRYKYVAAAAVLPFISAKAKKLWREIVEDVERELSVDLTSIKRFPRGKLIRFKAEGLGWYLLFKRSKTKRVFMVNAWHKPLIAGAQAAGAWFVEPQHGVISHHHGLLSFPNSQHIAYYPNELYLWGKSWGESVGIPADVKQTVIGHPRASDFAPSSSQVKNSVMVLSGAFHSTRLTNWTIAAAKANPKLSFSIKLHPQEYMRDFVDYDLPKNVKIVDSTVSTIQMMRESEYVVGVFSLGLVEAAQIGAKTIALKYPGWEHLESLIEKKALMAVDPAVVLDFSTLPKSSAKLELFKQALSDDELQKVMIGNR